MILTRSQRDQATTCSLRGAARRILHATSLGAQRYHLPSFIWRCLLRFGVQVYHMELNPNSRSQIALVTQKHMHESALFGDITVLETTGCLVPCATARPALCIRIPALPDDLAPAFLVLRDGHCGRGRDNTWDRGL